MHWTGSGEQSSVLTVHLNPKRKKLVLQFPLHHVWIWVKKSALLHVFRSKLPMFGGMNKYSQELAWLPWGCTVQTHVKNGGHIHLLISYVYIYIYIHTKSCIYIYIYIQIIYIYIYIHMLSLLQPLGRCETTLRRCWGRASGLRTRIRTELGDKHPSVNFQGEMSRYSPTYPSL